MPKKPTETGGNPGGYDYMQLLSDFALVTADFRWMNDAACRGRNDIDFFPEDNYVAKAAIATTICDQCPVKQQCLDFAIDNGIQYGIWGGLGFQQRRRYLRHGRNRGTV